MTTTGNFAGVAVDPVSGDAIAAGRDARRDQFGTGLASRVLIFSQTGLYQSQVDFGQLGAGEEGVRAVAADSAGGIVAGGSENFGLGEVWTIRRYSAGGASLLWSASSAGTTFFVASRVNAVAVDAAGVVGAGYENRPGWGGVNWLVAKYDPAGALVWSVSFAGTGTDAANAVAIDSAGDIYVAGSEDRSAVGQGLDWLVRKYDSLGALVWSRTHSGPGGGKDVAWGLAVDGASNVYVAGEEGQAVAGEGQNWLLIKYDSSGNVIWSRSFNGTASGSDVARAVGVSSVDGSIVAAGETENPGQGLGWLITKYDSSGNPLFSVSYDSPGAGDDSVYGLAVDGAGNMHAGGYAARADAWVSPTWIRKQSWMIRKYDSGGNLLWSSDAPIGRQDSASDIGVDFRNWAWVAGRDVRPGRGQDILLQVYSITQTGRAICATVFDYSRADEGPPSIYVDISYCVTDDIRRSETLLNFTSATVFGPSTQMTMRSIQGLFVGTVKNYDERMALGDNVTAAAVTRLFDNSRIALGTLNAGGADQLFAAREMPGVESCAGQDRISATYWSGSAEGIVSRAVAPALSGGFWALAEQGGDVILFKYSATSYDESNPTDLRAVMEAGYPKRLVTAATDTAKAAVLDVSGNLWVAGSIGLAGAIWKFSDSGVLVPGFPKQFAAAPSLVLSDIAVDDRGNALATGSAGGVGILLGIDAAGNPLPGLEQPLVFSSGPDSLEVSGISLEPGGAAWVAGTLSAGPSSSLWTGSMAVLYKFGYAPPPPSIAPGTISLETPGGAVINLLRGDRLVLLAHPTRGGIMHFKVMTMRGEPVWDYTLYTPGNQTEAFVWEGVNASGRQVASGAYAVRVSGAGLDEILRAVVIKR